MLTARACRSRIGSLTHSCFAALLWCAAAGAIVPQPLAGTALAAWSAAAYTEVRQIGTRRDDHATYPAVLQRAFQLRRSDGRQPQPEGAAGDRSGAVAVAAMNFEQLGLAARSSSAHTAEYSEPHLPNSEPSPYDATAPPSAPRSRPTR